jgi:hypothetical protein
VTRVSPEIIGELEGDGSAVPLRVVLLVVSTLGLDAKLRHRGATAH